MSTYNLYIGNTEDPQFDWNEQTQLLPEEILEIGLANGVTQFNEARDILLSADYQGRKLDMDSYGALASKADILDFINLFPQYPEWMQHAVAKADTLAHNEKYVIVIYKY